MPQAGTKEATIRSPGRTRPTSAPTSSTTPAPSWPRIDGGGRGTYPLTIERSEWQTPLASTSTVTSFGPGGRGVTSSIDSGSPSPTKIAARIFPSLLVV